MIQISDIKNHYFKRETTAVKQEYIDRANVRLVEAGKERGVDPDTITAEPEGLLLDYLLNYATMLYSSDRIGAGINQMGGSVYEAIYAVSSKQVAYLSKQLTTYHFTGETSQDLRTTGTIAKRIKRV